MTEYVLYAHPGACSRVTLSALEETQVEFRVEWINLHAKAQMNAEYQNLNRKTKVPTLSVDGAALTENPAILNFLDASHPETGLLPKAETPFEKAQGLSDLIWCSAMLHPIVRQIRAPNKWTVGSADGIKEDGAIKLTKECTYINERLSAATWWYGDNWSIMDVYLYWITNSAAKSGFSLDDFPAIKTHSEQVRARPSFQRGLAKERQAVQDLNMSIDPMVL